MDYIVSLYVTKCLNIMFYFMYVSFDKLDKALFFLYGTVFILTKNVVFLSSFSLNW